ncbi:hypothetical protein H0G86_002008 [Trichoderma simmonsii]|uniref:Uncharacterized protein n=1 Tax=Trichoderma simmonsii TaxID=1491479 RepID=A0A8G0PB25_9HYPO|nr:hypothetical protein H0G86_002008 [Trichoderma simmonsii]
MDVFTTQDVHYVIERFSPLEGSFFRLRLFCQHGRRVQIRYIFLPSWVDRLNSSMAWRSQSNARAKPRNITDPASLCLPPYFRAGAEVRKHQALELLKEGVRVAGRGVT